MRRLLLLSIIAIANFAAWVPHAAQAFNGYFVYFETGSAEMSLERIRLYLIDLFVGAYTPVINDPTKQCKIVLQSNSDEDEAVRFPDVSMRRGEAVRDYLRNHGFRDVTIEIRDYKASHPLVPTRGPEPQNRMVWITGDCK